MAGLHDPLPLPCGQVLPNRLMKSALSEGLGTAAHAPDDRLTTLFRRWGTGGYGLLVTGNVMIDREQLGEPGNVVIDDDRDLAALTRWAKAAKDGGTPVWMQLNHPGRQANPLAGRQRPVAPSAIASGVPGLTTPRALTGSEITGLIDRFATAARIAESAGFDGVQIHGAHGYLVSQFLSPLANRRDDEWGGDPQRRSRFLLEVVRAVRAAVQPGFAVAVKLNSADFQRGGFTEDESRAVVELLARESLDLIEISGGSYESPAMMGRSGKQASSTRAREAYFLEYAETVHRVASTVPLAVTGGFRSRTAMSAAVESGATDVVGLGRPTAVLPTAARELLEGGTEVLRLPTISLGLRGPLATNGALRALDGALDLQWHTDQLHRLGAGLDPDPVRSPWSTAVTMVRRNGFDTFRSRRGAGRDRKAVKFRFEMAANHYLTNPLFAALDRIGIRTTFATELETLGRKSGLPRRVPVAVLLDDEGGWIICQHGKRSGWGNNVAADPRVRLRLEDGWRTATAELRPDDDVVARARTFAPHPLLASLTAAGFAALQTDPVSVRITFTDR
ncbi:nitroreductase family deazaflavin-dependent oxidoreductase [Nocardia nova]|uniref:nitroreductase family deazaflavin-dependent oxidoreductase n=1 Tax=Nocardia nova TaxID=37330 RepID=UPI0033FCF44D